MQKIDPETVAHNVATTFVRQFVKTLKSPDAFDLDGPGICKSADIATQLYENVYDIAFERVTKENDSLDQEPEN